MADKIQSLAKGKTPTFLEAEFGNKIINLLNALANQTISPAGMGSFTATANNAVLDLSPIKAALDALSLQVANAGGKDTTTELIKNLNDRVTNIENRLANATIEGAFVCNEDGSITSTLTLKI